MGMLFVTLMIIVSNVLLSCDCSHLKFGHLPAEIEVIAVYTRFSYDKCHKACLARRDCLSLEVTVKSNLCRLFSVDTTTTTTNATMVVKPGIVFTEKRLWKVQVLDQECDKCSDAETCSVENNDTVCKYEECDQPARVNNDSVIMGNMKTVGSRVTHVCYNTTDRNSSECQSTGEWTAVTLNCVIDCGTTFPNGTLTDTSVTTVNAATAFTCLDGFYPGETIVTCQASGVWGPGQCHQLATDLNGLKCRVITNGTGEWWHYDSSGHVVQKWVTVKWQPTDSHVKFIFEEVSPGLYKLKSAATNEYIFDGGDYLTSVQESNTDYQQFLVYKENADSYRIISKRTGSYVRTDEDKEVSSQHNLKDARSLYRFDPA